MQHRLRKYVRLFPAVLPQARSSDHQRSSIRAVNQAKSHGFAASFLEGNRCNECTQILTLLSYITLSHENHAIGKRELVCERDFSNRTV
jgi:hypothetical protein